MGTTPFSPSVRSPPKPAVKRSHESSQEDREEVKDTNAYREDCTRTYGSVVDVIWPHKDGTKPECVSMSRTWTQIRGERQLLFDWPSSSMEKIDRDYEQLEVIVEREAEGRRRHARDQAPGAIKWPCWAYARTHVCAHVHTFVHTRLCAHVSAHVSKLWPDTSDTHRRSRASRVPLHGIPLAHVTIDATRKCCQHCHSPSVAPVAILGMVASTTEHTLRRRAVTQLREWARVCSAELADGAVYPMTFEIRHPADPVDKSDITYPVSVIVGT